MPDANAEYQFSKQTEVLWAGETIACFGLFYVVLVAMLGQSGVTAANHAAVYALTFGATALAAGIYRTDIRCAKIRLRRRALSAAVLSLPSVWLVSHFTPIDPPAGLTFSAHQALGLLLAQMAVIFVVRVIFGLALQSPVFSRRVLVLGGSAAITWIRGEGGDAYDVRHAAPAGLRDLAPLDGIWAVVADAPTSAALPAAFVQSCRDRGIRLLRDDAFLETYLRRIDVPGAAAIAETRTERAAPGLPGGGWTRAFDVAAAALLLVAVLPVMLAAMLMIKLEDGGPIFYRQTRIGLLGRDFTLFKFRSMRVDAEAQGPVWAQQRDPRITRVGAFIRRVRIDELPQIINILRGEMSIVGPRPERPHFVAQLCAAIPGYADRARVKPGLTGWAQVNYPYGASFEDARAKLSYDLYYVKHRSALLNLMTLFATVRVVLFQEGSR